MKRKVSLLVDPHYLGTVPFSIREPSGCEDLPKVLYEAQSVGKATIQDHDGGISNIAKRWLFFFTEDDKVPA